MSSEAQVFGPSPDGNAAGAVSTAPAAGRPPAVTGSARGDFLNYLGRKLVAALVSFGVLLVIGFVIFNLMPSDPVAALTRGRPTSAAQMAVLRHRLGLDQSLIQQFGH